MDVLQLDAEHEDFRSSFVRFCERAEPDGSVLREVGQSGFLGMQVAEELGGGGVDDPRFLAIGIEELCRTGRVGAALGYGVQAGVVLPLLVKYASRDITSRVVPQLATGQEKAGLVTTALHARADSGDWVVSGSSRTVLNGAGSSYLLITFSDEDGGRHLALTGADGPGVRLGADTPSRSLEGADIGAVVLEEVRVAAGDVLDSPAPADMVRSLQVWLAVVAVHGAAFARDLAVAYVQERKIFGRPLADFENTILALGRVAADVARARENVECALALSEVAEGSVTDVAPALLGALETFRDAADASLQLHGGYGYILEYPISTLFADAQLLLLLGMSTDPLAALGRELLGEKS